MSKKVLLLTILLLGQSLGMLAFESHSTSGGETYVYICTGPSSKKYHSTSKCYGLNSCSKEIKKVTKSYAVEKGRTPCKLCYK